MTVPGIICLARLTMAGLGLALGWPWAGPGHWAGPALALGWHWAGPGLTGLTLYSLDELYMFICERHLSIHYTIHSQLLTKFLACQYFVS